MRAMECPLEGHHLEADNDEELFKATREHADEVHRPAAALDHRGERLREVANTNTWGWVTSAQPILSLS
jgi:predicted small metal-binding protein